MRSRFDFRPFFFLNRLVRSGRFCLVHSHTTRTLLLASFICLFNRIPLVHHCHSSEVISSQEGLVDWINRKLESVLLRLLPDKVIAVSVGALAYLRAVGVPENRIACIHNGVPVSGTVCQFTRSDGIYRFACVALYRQRKGVEILLDAFALLLSGGISSARLSLIGNFETEEYRRQVEQYAQALHIQDHVVFEGFCGNVPARLLEMDCLVFPSVRPEGMPMVLLEAMSVGLPIIASNVEGAANLVNDGVNGVLVKPSDAVALATAMRNFVEGAGSDWLKDYGRQGYEIQRESYSDISMARDLARIYDALSEQAAKS
ncbi:MAG TPA: glycosyltransferase [Pseudomonadales bacterium]|nr:glycosyltransferase [Pseudomonadales bacterium]